MFLLGFSHPFLPNRTPPASRNSKKRWVRSVMNCDGYNCGRGGGMRRKWFSGVYTSLYHLSGGIRTIIGRSTKVHWTWVRSNLMQFWEGFFLAMSLQAQFGVHCGLPLFLPLFVSVRVCEDKYELEYDVECHMCLIVCLLTCIHGRNVLASKTDIRKRLICKISVYVGLLYISYTMYARICPCVCVWMIVNVNMWVYVCKRVYVGMCVCV